MRTVFLASVGTLLDIGLTNGQGYAGQIRISWVAHGRAVTETPNRSTPIADDRGGDGKV